LKQYVWLQLEPTQNQLYLRYHHITPRKKEDSVAKLYIKNPYICLKSPSLWESQRI